MKNIFENAYFSKPYRTRDGRKAIFQTIFQNRRVWAMVDKCPQLVPYHLDGTCEGDECFDIISEWEEDINEDELNKLAIQDIERMAINNEPMNATDLYKAGYRTAKQ